MMLCDRFPSMTPFTIRKERAYEVFMLLKKYLAYNKREKRKNKKVNGKKVIRKPAGDNWF